MFSSESEFESTEFILGILVNNPLNFEVTEKPVVEQTRKHNFMCTMNRKKIPIGSEKADGNGAYNKKGNTRKFHCFNDSVYQKAHLEEHSKRWYINVHATANSTFQK